MRWLILADDLTGAADAAGAFRRHGYPALLRLSPGGEEDWPVVSVDLNVRERAEDDPVIRRRVRETLRLARDRRVYLKIDSTLRGPVRTLVRETLAALKESGKEASGVFVCPAFPLQGRVTRGSVQYVRGDPAGTPESVGPPVCRLDGLFAGMGLRVVPLPPTETDKLSRLAREFPHSLFIADAELEADLEAWARSAAEIPSLLCVGSAGLAGGLARQSPMDLPPNILPSIQQVMVVAGSANPRTHAQLDRLPQEWKEKEIKPQGLEPAINYEIFQSSRDNEGGLNPEAAMKIIEEALDWVERMGLRGQQGWWAGWILTGGFTARTLLDRAGVQSLRVGGEVAPGVPWLLARQGWIAGSPIITKAGGFGEEDTLVRLMLYLCGCSPTHRSST